MDGIANAERPVVIDRRTMLEAGLAAGLAAALPSPLAARGDPVAATPAGRWSGLRTNGVAAFLGIRYGADPAAYRFQPPRPPTIDASLQRATAFGPSCPQRGGGAGQAEDCLFLNVWTPSPDRGRRPVMVYFHGGAYSGGTVVDPLVDGARLAAGQDVVLVTVNHRLNALGYLYLARLDPRFPDSGNAGQLDLVLALNWVRNNIAGFGGDPGRVMVFGQSGGGAKIATLMAMPAARGLFHAAATMSGQQVTASGPLNATRRAQAVLARLRVTPQALPTMQIERLVDALAAEDPILGGGMYMGPVLDMRSLERHPFFPDAHPLGNAVPLILGNTRDETRAFIDPRGPVVTGLTWDNLAERLGPQLRVDADPGWIVARYRERFPAMTPVELLYAASTAGRSWPGQVIEAEARARAGAPAWVYQFDYRSPVAPLRGAAHTDDIPFVFGTLDAKGSLAGTGAASRALSDRMMNAFAALARRGDPNHAGLPAWPRYDLTRRATMLFDDTSRVADDPRGWERTLFARFPYVQPGT